MTSSTERGLRIRPHAWISDEWFSPDDTPGIAIPFYLAHPRLMRLERKMIIDVEGGTRAGMHAHPAPRGRPRRAARLPAAAPAPLAGAVRPLVDPLSRTTIGRTRPASTTSSICGSGTRRAIRTRISPRPSRSGSRRAPNWRKRYAGWPALKKLEYVDELMAEIAGAEAGAHAPAAGRSAQPAHPDARRALREEAGALRDRPSPTIYDRDLQRIFSDDPRHRRSPAASAVLRRNRARDPADGLEVDGRVPADARRRARRHDRPLPRAEAARGRLRAAAA